MVDQIKRPLDGRTWCVIDCEITRDDNEPEQCFVVTNPMGWDPAFHPIFSSEVEASRMASILNRLRLTEDEYFDRVSEIDRAIAAGTVEKLARKYARRGFIRGFRRGLIGSLKGV